MRRHRRLIRTVGLAAVLAFTVVACNPAVDWSEGGEERRFWCDPTDTEVNDGHGGGHVGHHFPYTEEKGPLSWQDCALNAYFIEKGAAYAELFPTKGVAEANGWNWIAPWISGQGTHHVNPAGIPATFDPNTPTMLMFDGNHSSAPLTGMVWAVNQPPGSHPPAGFPGDNDHWHSHQSLCYDGDGFIIGDSITDEECASRGGVKVDTSGIWLVHVWLPEYSGWQATDIFNKTHPDI